MCFSFNIRSGLYEGERKILIWTIRSQIEMPYEESAESPLANEYQGLLMFGHELWGGIA